MVARAKIAERSDPLPDTIQESVLAVLAFDDGPAGEALAARVRPEHFEGQLRDAAESVLRCREDYSGPPGEAHLIDVLTSGRLALRASAAKRMAGRLALQAAAASPDYVLGRLGEFIRGQELKAAVVEAGERIMAGNENTVADVEAILTRALEKPVDAGGVTTGLALREFNALPYEPLTPVMRPWMNAGSAHILFGREGTMKTLLALHVAECLADCKPCLGGRWLPWNCHRVLFVDGELSVPQMKDRTERLRLRRLSNLTILSNVVSAIAGAPLPGLYTAEGRARIDREVSAARAQVVVLDSLFTLFGVELEREPEKWPEVDRWIKGHKAQGRSFLIIHHAPKSGRTAYGSVVKMAFADGIISLEDDGADDEDPAVRAVTVRFEKTRDFGGTDAQQFRALFKVAEDGGYRWSSEEAPTESDKKKESRQKIDLIQARLAQGKKSQKEIAEEVGVSASYVSQTNKRMREEGLLGEKEDAEVK